MSENSNNNTMTVAKGDFAKALKGEIKLTVGPLLQRSWDITLRSLPWMLGVFIGLLALNYVVSSGLALVFPFDQNAIVDQKNLDWSQLELNNLFISGLLQELILAPFSAMLIYVGMLNAADVRPSMAKLRGVLHCAPQLIFASFLKLAMIAISALILGFIGMFVGSFVIALIVLIVIYIQLAFMLAVPLIIDRQLSTLKAMLASFIVINKAMFPVLILMALMAIILMISAIPLFLGLIFTLPMAFNAVGVVYHALIGLYEDEVLPPASQADGDNLLGE